jgi:alpha-galactosidase
MPTWQGVLDILDATTKLAAYAGQGGYNDSDMLWVGNPGLSDTESRAYFSVWAILAAPLLASNDLTEMSAATRTILSQPDLIALNQDALHLQAVPLSTQGDVVILAKPLSQCGARGVVLLNRGEQAATGSVSFGALGLAPGPVTVRDLWAGTESSLEERFTATIAPHEAVALRLVGSERPLPRGEAYLSDLSFTSAANGWGPVETDRAVGESAAFDGGPITLAGHVYAKGLGVNSPSLVRYRLGKRCHELIADVGIDDVTKGAGSALFQVWADGEKLFDSGVMVGGMAPVHVNVDVSAKSEVRLWVGEVEDFAQDHADWADARVRCDE